MHATPAEIPKRIYFQMRFFSFPEIHTDSVALVEPGVSSQIQEGRPGINYYLAKDKIIEVGRGNFQRTPLAQDTHSDEDMLAITFEIDPSIS